MDEITDKEKLLKNIRNALIDKVENPFHDLDLDSSVYPPIEESPDIYFVRRFIEVGGKFVYCANELELSENLSDLLVNENLFPVFTPDERIRYLLLQNGIDLLICGAVSCDAERILSQKGIAVYAYLSGEADEIIKSVSSNKPIYEKFAMPGCTRKRQCGRMRHRCGKNRL